MGEPISTAAVFAFLNSCFKLAEYAVKLYGVESENGVFVRLIQRVRLDLEETERLLSAPSVKAKILGTPGKLPWIKGAILSTKTALNEIGKWVERVRAEKEGFGSATFETRVRYVFNDQEKLVSRSMELRTCHQSLSTILNYLIPLEHQVTAAIAEPPAYGDVTYFNDILPLSPAQMREKRERNERMGDQGTLSPLQHRLRPSSSMISLPTSPTSQSYFPYPMSPTPSSCQPASQVGSSNTCETIPTTRPYSGSLSSIYDSPLSSRFSTSSLRGRIPESSPLPTSAAECFAEKHYSTRPTLPTPASSSTITWPGYFSGMIEQSEATKATSPLNLQAHSSTDPPPPAYSPLSSPTHVSESASLYTLNEPTQTHPPSQTKISNATQDGERGNEMGAALMGFSGLCIDTHGDKEPITERTSLVANPRIPIPAREATLDQPTKIPASTNAIIATGSVESYGIWVEPRILHPTVAHDQVVKMGGDPLLMSPRNVSSNSPPQAPQPNNFPMETLPSTQPRNFAFDYPSEMPADMTVRHLSMPNIALELPAEVQQQPFEKVSRSNTVPSKSEMPSITVSQIPQTREQAYITFPSFLSELESPNLSRNMRNDAEIAPEPRTSQSKKRTSSASNLHRQITRKWIDAKPANYEGNEWGNEEWHRDRGQPASKIVQNEDQPVPLSVTHHQQQAQPPPQVWHQAQLESLNNHQFQSFNSDPRPGPSQKQQYQPYRAPLPRITPDSEGKIFIPPYPDLDTRQELLPHSPGSSAVSSDSPSIREGEIFIQQHPEWPMQQLNPSYSYIVPRLTHPAYIEMKGQPHHQQQQEQQHHQKEQPPPPLPPRSFTVSPLTQPSTPVHLSSSVELSRSETVSETRRRNQRALLALMNQGS